MKLIAIDPDIHKPGICAMHEDGEFMIESPKLCDFLLGIEQYYYDGYDFAIEDVLKNKPVFNRGKMTFGAKQKIAQNVGMVKAAQIIIVSMIENLGASVILVPPGIGKQVKRDAELFNRLSGWTGRSNEDTRDAWAIAKYVMTITGRSS